MSEKIAENEHAIAIALEMRYVHGPFHCFGFFCFVLFGFNVPRPLFCVSSQSFQVSKTNFLRKLSKTFLRETRDLKI